MKEKTIIHKFIFFLMRSATFRSLSYIPISVGNIFKKEKHRFLTQRAKSIEEKIFTKHLNRNLKVQAGPFKGLEYPSFKAYTSATIPKLLGTYESEIYPALNSLLKNEYDVIVDIGTAEGYYAVGLARLQPHAKVLGFDVNPNALEFCQKMAALNNVENLTLKGLFTKEEFRLIDKSRSLVICDVDGFEFDLFTKSEIDWFRNVDLVIETHDYLNPAITNTLLDYFKQTHSVELIHWKKKKHDEIFLSSLKNASNLEKEVAVKERIVDNKWIIATSKSID